MSVLVTGGAGYIGSHMVLALVDAGERVTVLDDLSTGRREIVSDKALFVRGNAGDRALVAAILARHGIESVVHFAGSIQVGESVERPLDYYANNVVVSRSLIETAIASGVKNFIFSSTGSVYEAASHPLSEDAVTRPLNPYSRSKLMVEWMLEDAARASSLRYAILRYFNVAGADPLGRTGQTSPFATHLLKRACLVALGRLPHLDILGTDYPTRDGTGVRDYIHVSDLVDAHGLALRHLRGGGPSAVLNCGYGRGLSVREVIAGVERVIGRALPVREGARRAGDSSELVSDPRRLKERLGWTPKHESLDEIIGTALAWETKLSRPKPANSPGSELPSIAAS